MKWICPACQDENDEEFIKCSCGYIFASEMQSQKREESDAKIASNEVTCCTPSTLYLLSFLLGLLLAILFPVTALIYARVRIIFGRSIATLFYAPIFFVIVHTLYCEGKKTFEKCQSKTPLLKIVGVLQTIIFIAGIYGSVWCRQHHISRDGHMASGTIPSEIFLDQMWATGLVSATIAAILFKKVHAPIFLTFTTWIIIFRFYFGSGGGIFPFPL
jgi:hypothetical protein